MLINKLMGCGLPAALAQAFCGDIADDQTAAGTTQTDALTAGTGVVRCTTVGSGTGLRLYNGTKGDSQIIINDGANGLAVYPPVGHTIDNLAANAAFTIPPSSWAQFERVTNTRWVASNDSATTSFVQSGTGAVSESVQTTLRREVWVEQFGAVGDGSTDDTTAIQKAIDSLTAGGIVLFDAKKYKFSALTITKPICLQGKGWASLVAAALGSTEWTTQSNFNGTVLISTATSGYAVDFTGAAAYSYRMQGILVIGPGSGTSTGIRIGTSLQASVQGRFVDVQASNFSQGWELNNLNEYGFHECRSRGNTSGWLLQNAVNNCAFDGWEIQHSTLKGAVLDNANGNVFTNSLLQNISGTVGLEITRGNDNNHFNGGWAETITATWAVNIGTSGSGSSSASFIGWRTSVANGFNVDVAVGCVFINCRMLSAGITTTANASGTLILGCNLTLTDGGAGTTQITQTGVTTLGSGSAISIPIGQISTSASALQFKTAGGRQFQVTNTNTAVNFWQATGSATGIRTIISLGGTDTDVSAVFTSKGAGTWDFATGANNNEIQFQITQTASASRFIKITGSNGGNPTITTSAGSLAITPAIVTASSLTLTGAFGCNTKAAQTAFASGGALNTYGAGANGLDSGANMSALHAMVVAIRAALVANGVMS